MKNIPNWANVEIQNSTTSEIQYAYKSNNKLFGGEKVGKNFTLTFIPEMWNIVRNINTLR